MKRLAGARWSWAEAITMAPHLEEAPAVARILEALYEALDIGDEKAVRVIDAGARRALEHLDPAMAAREYSQYQAMGQLAPGVTVDAFRRVGGQRGVGRNSDRARALDGLAERMDSYLTRPTRRSAASGAPLGRLTPDRFTRGFLVFVSLAEPIAGELKRRKLIAVKHSSPHGDERAARAVGEAFQELFASTAYEELTPQRLVSVGLAALGYPTRNLFGHLRKRDRRARPRRGTRPSISGSDK